MDHPFQAIKGLMDVPMLGKMMFTTKNRLEAWLLIDMLP